MQAGSNMHRKISRLRISVRHLTEVFTVTFPECHPMRDAALDWIDAALSSLFACLVITDLVYDHDERTDCGCRRIYSRKLLQFLSQTS
jgi:hypothetical protein